MYDPAELLAERGLTPAQVIDLKGFMGDTSDNYPGVKGIGEKTATKLLTEYGTVEGVIENLHLLPKGVRAKIEADLDMLHLAGAGGNPLRCAGGLRTGGLSVGTAAGYCGTQVQ